MNELKPCPDCGGRMKIDYKFHPLRYAVVHESKFYSTGRCYGGTDYEFQSETEAIEAWNRRVNDDTWRIDVGNPSLGDSNY